jgi:hypothetical protein
MRTVAIPVVLMAAAVGGVPQETRSPKVALDPITAIVDAFRAHRIVALSEEHGDEQCHAFRLALVRDPRFAAVVDDIVVEFGSARYQDVIDRFIRGDDVPYETLRQVWQNTTIPHAVWDRPIYEEFYRAIRAVNLSLPAGRRLRVLLGDPPIDWDGVASVADIRERIDRSRHPAAVIEREVLARNRRALVIYGAGHLRRQNVAGPALVDWLDGMAKGQVFTVLTGSDLSLAVVQPDVKTWRVPGLTLTKGTSLDNQLDAVLYLGPLSARTWSRLSSALCADAEYRSMRVKRMALTQGVEKAAAALNEECGGQR